MRLKDKVKYKILQSGYGSKLMNERPSQLIKNIREVEEYLDDKVSKLFNVKKKK